MYVGGWTWKIAAGSFFLFLFSYLLFFFWTKSQYFGGLPFSRNFRRGKCNWYVKFEFEYSDFQYLEGWFVLENIVLYFFKERWVVDTVLCIFMLFLCDLYVCFCALIILLWLCHFWSIIGDNDTRIKFSCYLLVIKFMWVL